MKIGIDLGGSHVGVGLIENYELRQTVDRFFTNEDKDDMEGAVIRNIDELINQLLYENKLSMDQITSLRLRSILQTINMIPVTTVMLLLRHKVIHCYLAA